MSEATEVAAAASSRDPAVGLAGVAALREQVGELVLAPLRESVARYAIPSAARRLSVVSGGLGARAEVLGALALALSEVGDSTLLDADVPAAAAVS